MRYSDAEEKRDDRSAPFHELAQGGGAFLREPARVFGPRLGEVLHLALLPLRLPRGEDLLLDVGEDDHVDLRRELSGADRCVVERHRREAVALEEEAGPPFVDRGEPRLVEADARGAKLRRARREGRRAAPGRRRARRRGRGRRLAAAGVEEERSGRQARRRPSGGSVTAPPLRAAATTFQRSGLSGTEGERGRAGGRRGDGPGRGPRGRRRLGARPFSTRHAHRERQAPGGHVVRGDDVLARGRASPRGSAAARASRGRTGRRAARAGPRRRPRHPSSPRRRARRGARRGRAPSRGHAGPSGSGRPRPAPPRRSRRAPGRACSRGRPGRCVAAVLEDRVGGHALVVHDVAKAPLPPRQGFGKFTWVP